MLFNFGRAVLLLMFVLLVGTASAQEADVPDQPVKLAVLAPITGAAAHIGEEQVQWVRLAISDFNEATGWNVELVEVDTQIDPAVGLLAAESVIADEDVLGVVGPAGSQVVQATQPLFAEAGLVHVSSSATSPALTQEGFETFFRVVPHDDVQGPTDATFLREELGIERLFLIDDQTAYAVNINEQVTEVFTDLGGEVVGSASISQDDQDFSALVTRIAALDAEAIFFAGQVASQGALLANQLQEQGVEVTLFGTDGFFFPTEFIEEADGATEGAYVSVFAPDIRSLESSSEIVERYTERFDDNFGSFGPPTYAAAMVVLEAMQRAYENGDLSRETVLAEVAATDQELTVLGGPLRFDENGDVEGAAFYIFQVQDGQFVMVGEEADSDT